MYHLNSGRRIYLNFVAGEKPQVKSKVLQDAKKKAGQGLLDWKSYFQACSLASMKEQMVLRDKSLSELEEPDLRSEEA